MVSKHDQISSAEVRSIFKKHGLSPKKWMGQNLLVDPAYLTKIVESALIKPDDKIVEIGAGLGVLTSALQNAGAQVWALEIDNGFFRVLCERFQSNEAVHLLREDATKFDFQDLHNRIGPLKVVSNLPYSASSRILFSIVQDRSMYQSITMLLQKEVAQRLIEKPGQKEYGVLSVLTQAAGNTELLFHIPPKAFYPKPKVDSTTVRITFTDPAPVHVEDWSLMVRLVKASFSSRRKTLWNNLSSMRAINVNKDTVQKGADAANIDLSRRGETLTAQEFALFANAILECDQTRQGGVSYK